MRTIKANVRVIITTIVIGLPWLLSSPVFADTTGVTSVENFIRSLIQVLAGLAGLIATVFFVFGGFGYITSSGNPERLQRSKHTLVYSGIGLSITIGAYVLSNIVTGLATKAFGS